MNRTTTRIILNVFFLLIFPILTARAENECSIIGKYQINGIVENSFRTIEVIDKNKENPILYLETRWREKANVALRIPLSASFLSADHLAFDIKYKAENCKRLYCIFTSVGDCEERMLRDTIELRTDTVWQAEKKNARIRQARLVGVEIEAVVNSSNKAAKVWLTDFSFSNNENQAVMASTDSLLLALSSERLLSLEELVHQSIFQCRILGIGESVHGTKDFLEMVISLIRERIEKQQCRYVMMELPLGFSLYVNRYIHGDSHFNIGKIQSYLKRLNIDETVFLSFVDWLKTYNATHREKVSFYGFDNHALKFQGSLELITFFQTLFGNQPNEELERISKALINLNNSPEDTYQQIKKVGVLARKLTPTELSLIKLSLDVFADSLSAQQRIVYRDVFMSQIVSFVADSVARASETITLFGHCGHVERGIDNLGIYGGLPLGQYLHEKYGTEYSALGLMTQGGERVAINLQKKAVEQFPLTSPPPYSMEYWLSQAHQDVVYMSMERLRCEDFLYWRRSGTHVQDFHFVYVCPKVRLDGVIFVRTVKPAVLGIQSILDASKQ
ncbi:erythromycin esterase family protein [Bacteroides heparinolyticus]|uniref:erythromycin esterase family protein n=1 Tax=Prevotella heparinolytica TaxID=28113 RepID=UPI00359F7204